MKLYYVEYHPSKDDGETFAHYLEVTDLGTIIEHKVSTCEDQGEYHLADNVFRSWSDYYDTYKGGKTEFLKQGSIVRLL